MNIVEVRCIAAGMTMAQHLFPPNQETASTERHKQAFVWIQHNAIGVFDACQSLPSPLGLLKEAAVCRIDMVPETFVVRYLGKLRQRIDRTGVSCFCVCRDAGRQDATISVASKRCLQ